MTGTPDGGPPISLDGLHVSDEEYARIMRRIMADDDAAVPVCAFNSAI